MSRSVPIENTSPAGNAIGEGLTMSGCFGVVDLARLDKKRSFAQTSIKQKRAMLLRCSKIFGSRHSHFSSQLMLYPVRVVGVAGMSVKFIAAGNGGVFVQAF
jgi:hypothetical protein